MLLPTAIKDTLLEARLSLGFIPLVGRWFVRRPEDHKRDDNHPID